MGTFAFFSDAGMTAQLSTIDFIRPQDGSGYVDRLIYLGSPAWLKLLEAASAPGEDMIAVSVVDSAPGSGVQASHVRLAYVQEDLETATPGAPLELAAMIGSKPSSGSDFWIRVETPALAAGVYNELTLTTNAVIEVDDV